jgi:hypothetical protein
VPPGWTYNPSSWLQRAPLIATGFLGWFISRYLAAVQLGYTAAAWEPFFGEGTARVLCPRRCRRCGRSLTRGWVRWRIPSRR